MTETLCSETCTAHGMLCALTDGHDDDHGCTACPSYLRFQRKQQIAERVAAHKALRNSGFVAAPDED